MNISEIDNIPLFRKKLSEGKDLIRVVSLAPGQFWDGCKDIIEECLQKQIKFEFILPDTTQKQILQTLKGRDVDQRLPLGDHLFRLSRVKDELITLSRKYPNLIKIVETQGNIFGFIIQVDIDWIFVTYYIEGQKSKDSDSGIYEKTLNRRHWVSLNQSISFLNNRVKHHLVT